MGCRNLPVMKSCIADNEQLYWISKIEDLKDVVNPSIYETIEYVIQKELEPIQIQLEEARDEIAEVEYEILKIEGERDRYSHIADTLQEQVETLQEENESLKRRIPT